MENLFFQENYNNKLGNEVLTTIRLEDPEKFKIGNVFTLLQSRGKINFGQYQVIDTKIINLPQMNNWITQLDAGMDVEQFKTLMMECYPNQITPATKYSYVLLKKMKVEIQQQSMFH